VAPLFWADPVVCICSVVFIAFKQKCKVVRLILPTLYITTEARTRWGSRSGTCITYVNVCSKLILSVYIHRIYSVFKFAKTCYYTYYINPIKNRLNVATIDFRSKYFRSISVLSTPIAELAFCLIAVYYINIRFY